MLGRSATRMGHLRSRLSGNHLALRFLATSGEDAANSTPAASIWQRLKNWGAPYKPPSCPPSKPKTTGRPKVADVATSVKHTVDRLPNWSPPWDTEFPKGLPDRRGWEASLRIVRIAADAALEPSAVALLGASTCVVLTLAAGEGILLSSELHTAFVLRYAVEQLLPSCVWSTQDASLVATAMGLDPLIVLKQLNPSVPADAQTILYAQMLEAGRAISAGFMLLAQLVRVGTIGADAPTIYMDRLKLGREPPMLSRPMLLRLCGRDSDATSTSLRRMGRHILPVYEEPERIAHLVQGKRYPVYWCVRPGQYGHSYSWRSFPVDETTLLQCSTGRKVLLLEADATNPNDPLSLGDYALDLTLDDASQGFRRIEELYKQKIGASKFRTCRVFLGNSLEIAKSGGGHAYTLRHRVRFAKEMDVLIDSRAPVLQEVLRWCDRVAGKDRRILFQTSSQQYFRNLRLLMRNYGYKIYDPLDWRMLDELEDVEGTEEAEKEVASINAQDISLLQVLVDEEFMEYANVMDRGSEKRTKREKKAKRQLRQITKLSRLPRIVYYGNTAETVNAVQALVNARVAEVANCCAILDKEEGMTFLTKVLQEEPRGAARLDDVIQYERRASNIDNKSNNGLHIVCSATIYDDLFRQVRQWTRMGYAAKEIQTELDIRFEDMIQQTQHVKEVLVHDKTEDYQEEAAPDPAKVETVTPTPAVKEESNRDRKH